MEISGGGKLEAYLKQTAKKVSNAATVRVGFLEGATYPDGAPVAMIAAIQNFGAPSRGIPPRPFFTNMVTKEGAHWPDDIASLLKANNMDAKTALTLMGLEIENELRDSIIETNEPPNSMVTNLLKQRFPVGGASFADVLQAREDVAKGVTARAGRPLVQSGHLLRSVDSEVT
jgi:hypothetical protein